MLAIASAPNLSDLIREALVTDQPGMRLTAARIASIGSCGVETRHVNPIYQAAARKAGVKGTTGVESVFTTAGCLTDVTVLRSAGSALDFASLETVTNWRYAPTFLDGKPVEVLMSIEVAFK